MYKFIGGLFIYGPTKVLWEINLDSFLLSILELLFGTFSPKGSMRCYTQMSLDIIFKRKNISANEKPVC